MTAATATASGTTDTAIIIVVVCIAAAFAAPCSLCPSRRFLAKRMIRLGLKEGV